MKKNNRRIFIKTICISGGIFSFIILVFYVLLEIENRMHSAIFGREVYVEIVNFMKDMLK